MSYNVLYGILTAGLRVPSTDKFYKKCTCPSLTDKGRRLLALMLPADVSRRPLFASVVCAYALDTEFGAQIRSMDHENTYYKPTRHDGERSGVGGELSDSLLAYDLTGNTEKWQAIISMLDSDLVDRLNAPRWIDVMAAACLQLLREAY